MVKSGMTRRALVIMSLLILVVAAFIVVIYLLPGETYLVHVTVINNATPDSAHQSVYVINNVYVPGGLIDAKYLSSPGSTRTYDLSGKFSGGSNASYTFRAVDAGTEIANVSYAPKQAVSNVTITWDGASLSAR